MQKLMLLAIVASLACACFLLPEGAVMSVDTSEPAASHVFLPPFKGWKVNSYGFGEDCSYPTEDGKEKHWGLHLGEDCDVEAGTVVGAIGDGKVMYVGPHPGESKDKRNWGGLVILAHRLPNKNFVYSLYGHLVLDASLTKGQQVKRGDALGTVAPKDTPENGWWEEAHLHLQIIVDQTDVYRGGVLRGYASDKAPNRVADCVAPSAFFEMFGPGR